MNRISCLLLLAIGISSMVHGQKKGGGFEIIGEVKGFRDSTVIKLWDFSTGSNVYMDSAIILNGKFSFRGSITTGKSYQQVGLISSDFRNIRTFWLENKVIHFKAELGKFQESVITGSAMQEEADELKSLLKSNPGNDRKVQVEYIRSHPRSLISANTLKVFGTSWGKDTTKMLFDGLHKSVQQSEFGQAVQEYLSLAKDIKMGGKYADFTLPNINNKDISLSDYKNKYVLLDFWGSWCGPCRKENPNLVKLYAEYKSKGFEILGVSIETNRNAWLQAMEEDNITWECVSDLKGDKNKAALIYGTSYYPTNYLIDRNGNIIAKDLRGEELRKKLDELLR